MRPKFRGTIAWDTDIAVCDRTPMDIVSRDLVKSATNPAPEGRPNIAQRFSAGKTGNKRPSPGGTAVPQARLQPRIDRSQISAWPHKRTHSPDGRHTHRGKKGHPHQSPRHRALAPALEHRHQSNQKQHDRARGKKLCPHRALLRYKPPIQTDPPKRTPITRCRDPV